MPCDVDGCIGDTYMGWRPLTERRGRKVCDGVPNIGLRVESIVVKIPYPIKADRLYEELYKKTKRWTWRGKPTKNARKLQILEQRAAVILDAYYAFETAGG